jgi:hypothetical protein
MRVQVEIPKGSAAPSGPEHQSCSLPLPAHLPEIAPLQHKKCI